MTIFADLRGATALHEAGHVGLATLFEHPVEWVKFKLWPEASQFGETKSLVGGPGVEAYYLDECAIISAAGLVELQYRDGWRPHDPYRAGDLRKSQCLLSKVGCHHAFVEPYLAYVDEIITRGLAVPGLLPGIRAIASAFEEEIGEQTNCDVPEVTVAAIAAAYLAPSKHASLVAHFRAELPGAYKKRQWPWP